MPRRKRNVPWLDQRGDTFYACWYDPGACQTRRLSLRTTDPVEAQNRFAAFLVAGPAVTGQAPTGGLTVRQAVDDYLREHAVGNADRVRAEGIGAHLTAWFGDAVVANLTIQDCRDYKAARNRGEGATPKRGKPRPAVDGTVRRELVVLTAAINHAVKWKRLPGASAPSIELPQEGERAERWLTQVEMGKLRGAAAARVIEADMKVLEAKPGKLRVWREDQALVARRVRDFIEIAYYTGSRREAVERLTKFQVNLETARIALALPGERKTKKRRPVVAIDPQLMPTIRRCYETSPTEYVLVNNHSLYRPFMACAKAAGLDDTVTPHTLRHSRATHLLQAGATPWAVAKLLGDTLATVDRVYGHHSVEFMAEMMAESGGTESGT